MNVGQVERVTTRIAKGPEPGSKGFKEGWMKQIAEGAGDHQTQVREKRGRDEEETNETVNKKKRGA